MTRFAKAQMHVDVQNSRIVVWLALPRKAKSRVERLETELR